MKATEKQISYYKYLVTQLRHQTNWTDGNERRFYETHEMFVKFHIDNLKSKDISKLIGEVKECLI